MYKVDYKSSLFDEKSVSDYQLIIFCISNERLIWCVLNAANECLLVLHAETFDIQVMNKVYNTHSWLSKGLRSIQMITVGEGFTLIPKDLFEENKKKAFLDFNLKTHVNFAALHEIIEDDIVNVFASDKTLVDFLKQKHNNIKLNHAVESILKNHTSDDGDHVFVLPHSILYHKKQDGKLMQFESYSTESKTDQAYFILKNIEQNGGFNTLQLKGHLQYCKALKDELAGYIDQQKINIALEGKDLPKQLSSFTAYLQLVCV